MSTALPVHKDPRFADHAAICRMLLQAQSSLASMASFGKQMQTGQHAFRSSVSHLFCSAPGSLLCFKQEIRASPHRKELNWWPDYLSTHVTKGNK